MEGRKRRPGSSKHGALSCRSCQHRSWSRWGSIEQRDDIVDLGAAASLKERTSKPRAGSEADRSPTPSAPNITKRLDIGMTHSSEESPEWFAIVRESFRAWGASSYQKPNGRRSR